MDRETLRRFVRSARHGWPPRYPVAQLPNAPLVVALGGGAVARATDGGVRDAAMLVSRVALAVWAVQEIVWGANAVRRALGVGGLLLAAGVIRA
jgi:hypothetical protein